MLRKLILWVFAAVPLFLSAQKNNLVIQGNTPSFYLNHTVGTKENYYSIGRMYNSSPSQQIVPFNNAKLEAGLKVGQVLRIPLNENNFTQSSSAAADEVLVPVQHVAGDKETLSGISSRFNKVPAASLRKWNNLDKDQIAKGSRLTVGYLKVKKDQSPLASLAVPASVLTADAVVRAESLPASKTEPEKPAVKTPEPAKKNQVVETTPAPKKAEVVAAPPPAPPVVKEKTEKDKKKTDNPPSKPATDAAVKSTGSGFFKSAFDKQDNSNENRSGSAGIFKSTSGWDDGKYYCLYNDATPGTIVKVTNSSNSKFIYAKVLDAIPDMKQNEGLIIRISNSAANELEVSGNSFDCSVSY